MEAKPSKAARGDLKGRRMVPFWRRIRRDAAVLVRSEDREVEISIKRMPASVDVSSVKAVVVYVDDGSAASGALEPAGEIDESTREVFARVGEEYDELCDRLFADDPVFSYGTNEDAEPQ